MTTPNGMTVEKGQRWVDCDKRINRVLEVVDVDNDNRRVLIRTVRCEILDGSRRIPTKPGRVTWASLHRFNCKSRGYMPEKCEVPYTDPSKLDRILQEELNLGDASQTAINSAKMSLWAKWPLLRSKFSSWHDIPDEAMMSVFDVAVSSSRVRSAATEIVSLSNCIGVAVRRKVSGRTGRVVNVRTNIVTGKAYVLVDESPWWKGWVGYDVFIRKWQMTERS